MTQIHLSDITHTVVDKAKHTLDSVSHVIESKEKILHTFEETGWSETHEHRFLHAWEAMFSHIMMLMWG
jgi:hypothetical protein